jgi:lipooligosaccharide transport system permease protein
MRRAMRVWQRDLKVWSKYCGVSLVSNLGEPLLYILAIGLGLGRYVGEMDGVSYLMFLGPAVLAASVMNSASFETTFSSYTRMSVQKTFDGILATPVSANEVIAGEILWGATKSVITGSCMLVVLAAFGLVEQLALAWIVLPVALLSGVLFASLGMLVTSFAKSYDFFAYYFTLILGPMFFFSGTFFPLAQLPDWAQSLSWLMPLTHCVRLMRGLLLGRMSHELWFDVLWLAFVGAVLFAAALWRMRRRLRV